MGEIEIRLYVDESGRAPFETWLVGLDVRARAKVTVALFRLERGNRSQVKAWAPASVS